MHIGHMGGKHWRLYLKQWTLLDIAPDERATPKAILEEQRERFSANQFVFELQYICSSIYILPTDAIKNASPTFMAQPMRLSHGLSKGCSTRLKT